MCIKLSLKTSLYSELLASMLVTHTEHTDTETVGMSEVCQAGPLNETLSDSFILTNKQLLGTYHLHRKSQHNQSKNFVHYWAVVLLQFMKIERDNLQFFEIALKPFVVDRTHGWCNYPGELWNCGSTNESEDPRESPAAAAAADYEMRYMIVRTSRKRKETGPKQGSCPELVERRKERGRIDTNSVGFYSLLPYTASTIACDI